MAKQNLKDPVEETEDQGSFEMTLEAAADPEILLEDEVGSLPASAVRSPHPFDGYPLARKVRVGESMISATYLILLVNDEVFQDESGKNVSHAFFAKDEKGMDIKKENVDGKFYPPKVDRIRNVTISSVHNRITSHPSTGENTDNVFDRQVMVGSRMRTCAIVPSHSARAQIFMQLDKTGKVVADKRYQLADKNQAGRLLKVFQRVNYQHLKAERLAQQFDAEPESLPEGR